MIANGKQLVDERDVLDLIARRAHRMGLRGADLDDAVQEVAPAALEFEFEESRSNGARYSTALTSVIDRRLHNARLRESRYEKHLQAAVEERQTLYDLPDGPREPYYEERTSLCLDVRSAIAELSPDDQAICAALSEGYSVHEIATRLGCHWQTVSRRITHIRERFTKLGLNDWIND